jgi:hypothetical protein
MKDNAWFVGFAPRDTPEIVVVALFEGGEHGNLAAPIVRDVIKSYFDKQVRLNRNTQLASLPSFQPGVIPPRAARPGPKPTVVKVSDQGAEIEE